MTRKPKHTLDAEVHPAADLFPLMDDDELQLLADDIKHRGLQLPVVLDSEGRILDGRNRARACVIAGVEATTTTYTGDNPEMYVLSANAYRRHMSKGARAMVIGLVLAKNGKRRNGRWVRGSVYAATSGSGSIAAQRMTEVGLIIDHGDEDIIKRVANDDLTLTAAVELTERTKTAVAEAEADEFEALIAKPDVAAELKRRAAEADARADDAGDPKSPAAPKKPREREVLNPVQRKERRALADQRDEVAFDAIRPLLSAIDFMNEKIISAGVRELTGKPRARVIEDLERLRVTIDNALIALGRKEGE